MSHRKTEDITKNPLYLNFYAGIEAGICGKDNPNYFASLNDKDKGFIGSTWNMHEPYSYSSSSSRTCLSRSTLHTTC